jgi:hypothetical protein
VEQVVHDICVLPSAYQQALCGILEVEVKANLKGSCGKGVKGINNAVMELRNVSPVYELISWAKCCWGP